jgi:hypothetical protein
MLILSATSFTIGSIRQRLRSSGPYARTRNRARAILIERIIPETSAFDISELMDLAVLTFGGGQERTAAEYRQLLENTGFELEQIVPTPAGRSLIISRTEIKTGASLNQKDFKSATIQAAPVTRKVRAHSDQLKCAFG